MIETTTAHVRGTARAAPGLRTAYSMEVFDRPDGWLIEVLARAHDLDMARAAYLVAWRSGRRR